jgi:glycosyltransferase involved in cell wall biosynthesis
MKKKLIIFIPSIEDGGVEKNLFIISNYLIKKIDYIELITCNTDKKIEFNKKIKIIGPNNSFWLKKNRYYKYFYCLIILIQRIFFHKKNILIFSFQANIYTIFIAKIFNVKIITRSNSSPSGWSKNYIKNLIFKFLLKKADSIIVNSIYFQKEFYKKFKIHTQFIYNPFDKQLINNKIKDKTKIDFYEKNNLKIIAVGRLTDQKDHITLLKAFKLIHKKLNPKLLILGKGIKYQFLKEYIKNNYLTKRVKLFGYTKNPYPIIKKSDIVVLTSKFEGLPNILLEAQYLKKYIISTDCPTGPREILSNGKFGTLIKIGDYKSLAHKINLFYKNKKFLKKKIHNGYLSLNRFNYNVNCRKYLNLIERFI